LRQLCRVVASFTLCSVVTFGMGFPSSYYKIKSGKKQREEFVKILKPIIEDANQKVLKQRAFVIEFFNEAVNKSFREIEPVKLQKLDELSKKYKIKNLFDKDEYLKKIDIVPLSLAVAQAAVESAWGKSRFLKEANNIFGHWTWGEIGIIPAKREEGKTHKIKIFKTLEDSVSAYILNLNSHNAYEEFRDLRHKKRLKGEILNGYEAAKTMKNYSELGQKYVKILQKMIKDYNLEKLDYSPASLIATD